MLARLRSVAFSRAAFPAWALLGVCLLLTVLFGLGVKRSIDANAKLQFASTCDEIAQKIRERLAFYDVTIRGGVGLFDRAGAVSRSEWQTYFEKLTANKPLPGMQGFGFIKLIRPYELQSHISAVRAEGFPDYTVRPEGRREVYAPIVYTEPFRGRNVRALGMDVFAEPIRRAAMEQSRDSGRSAITGKIILYQETDKDVQAGFAMFAPVYRAGVPLVTTEQRRSALVGWIDSAYRMRDMIEDILQHSQPQLRSRNAMFIYDQEQPIATKLLYRSSSAGTPDPNSLFYVERKIDFNDHSWLVIFDRDPLSLAGSHAAVWLSIAAGVVISALLFVLALSYRSSEANPPLKP